MTLFTIIIDSTSGAQLVDKCEHQSWNELIEDGWQFIGTKGAHVLMTRRGYINEFWEVKP